MTKKVRSTLTPKAACHVVIIDPGSNLGTKARMLEQDIEEREDTKPEGDHEETVGWIGLDLRISTDPENGTPDVTPNWSVPQK